MNLDFEQIFYKLLKKELTRNFVLNAKRIQQSIMFSRVNNRIILRDMIISVFLFPVIIVLIIPLTLTSIRIVNHANVLFNSVAYDGPSLPNYNRALVNIINILCHCAMKRVRHKSGYFIIDSLLFIRTCVRRIHEYIVGNPVI